MSVGLEWESWADASPITEKERDAWAQKILDGEITASQCGDSYVWSMPSGDGRICIYDAKTRRSAFAPAPPAPPPTAPEQQAKIEALAEALELVLDAMGKSPGREAEAVIFARAALRLAGRQ